jgi:hypothetical protein
MHRVFFEVFSVIDIESFYCEKSEEKNVLFFQTVLLLFFPLFTSDHRLKTVQNIIVILNVDSKIVK